MSTSAKKIIKRTVNIAFYIIIALLAILIILSVYSKKSGKAVLPYSIMWVLTDSMEDTIPEKSYILVHKVDAQDVEEGDVITFHSSELGGSLNTHRVVKIDDEGYWTKGDNPLAPYDPDPVKAEDIVARYVRNLPVMTFFGRLYSTPAGLAVTLIIIIAGMALWFFFAGKKMREESRKNEDDEMNRRIAEEVERLRREAENADKAQNASETAEAAENSDQAVLVENADAATAEPSGDENAETVEKNGDEAASTSSDNAGTAG